MLNASKQFGNRPNMICQPRFHRWRNPQRLMYPAKIVVSKMQSASGFQVVQFLRERICQTGHAPDGHPHRQVASLNKACRNPARVGPSITYLDYGFNHRRGRVSTSGVVLPVIAEQLYHLREVSLSSENIFYAFFVKVESIRAELKPVVRREAVPYCIQELVCGLAVALADYIRWNQFCVCVQRDKDPSIPELRRIADLEVPLFFENPIPNFVGLQVFTAKVLDPRIQKLYASLTCQNQQAKNRVTMQTRNPFSTSDTGAFHQKLNRQKCTIFRHCHRAEQPRMFFGVGFPTLRAAESLQSIAVPPKFPASAVA